MKEWSKPFAYLLGDDKGILVDCLHNFARRVEELRDSVGAADAAEIRASLMKKLKGLTQHDGAEAVTKDDLEQVNRLQMIAASWPETNDTRQMTLEGADLVQKMFLAAICLEECKGNNGSTLSPALVTRLAKSCTDMNEAYDNKDVQMSTIKSVCDGTLTTGQLCEVVQGLGQSAGQKLSEWANNKDWEFGLKFEIKNSRGPES